MTNAELLAKIRAEIERRYKEFDGKTGDIATASRLAYLDVISFLSTLESEKRMNQEGLEEAASEYSTNEADRVWGKPDPHDYTDHSGCGAAHDNYEVGLQVGFKAGAKWQKEHSFTHHETNESLEEAVTHQMEDDGDVDDFIRKTLDKTVLKYAQIGAEWQKQHVAELIEIAYNDGITIGMTKQKEQMMKEAVEGEITKDNRGNNVVRAGVFNEDFEYGDKIRIIIVKED